MSAYLYHTIPKMEADTVEECVTASIHKAKKIAENLRSRLSIFESNLEIEREMIRNCGTSEVFTCAPSLSDEVFSALRFACNELNTLSIAPPAVELRPDPEAEKKRYYRNVVLPQDQVVSHLTEDAIFVRTPMLWSRNNRMVRGGKGRTIGPEKCTVYRDSVYYSIILDPEFQSYDFSKFKKKIIHYLYIYRDLPENKMYLIDNDNHETKHVTDAIARLLPAGDTPLNCNFFSSAQVTDLIPEGTYITVTAMDHGVLSDTDIVDFWRNTSSHDELC